MPVHAPFAVSLSRPRWRDNGGAPARIRLRTAHMEALMLCPHHPLLFFHWRYLKGCGERLLCERPVLRPPPSPPYCLWLYFKHKNTTFPLVMARAAACPSPWNGSMKFLPLFALTPQHALVFSCWQHSLCPSRPWLFIGALFPLLKNVSALIS